MPISLECERVLAQVRAALDEVTRGVEGMPRFLPAEGELDVVARIRAIGMVLRVQKAGIELQSREMADLKAQINALRGVKS